MKATHKLTYLPDGDKYLFCVIGNDFHWSREGFPGWVGPDSMFAETYVGNPYWSVKKIKTFKGNK